MIVNRQRRVPVALPPLRLFYERVRRELGFSPESVTIQLISDDSMARLNEKYRNKPGPTDVLSFPANGARPSRSVEYIGDIAISAETAPSHSTGNGAGRACAQSPHRESSRQSRRGTGNNRLVCQSGLWRDLAGDSLQSAALDGFQQFLVGE